MVWNFLPLENVVDICINNCYSGSSHSAAITFGIHRRMVCAGHLTTPPPHHDCGDRAGGTVFKVPKCRVFSRDLNVLRAYSDSCRSRESASLLTSVLTFISYVPKQHAKGMLSFSICCPCPQRAGWETYASDQHQAVLNINSPSQRPRLSSWFRRACLFSFPWDRVPLRRCFGLLGGSSFVDIYLGFPLTDMPTLSSVHSLCLQALSRTLPLFSYPCPHTTGFICESLTLATKYDLLGKIENMPSSPESK